jgi:hypothetical protein
VAQVPAVVLELAVAQEAVVQGLAEREWVVDLELGPAAVEQE